ncbi:MAG: hypothetical protein P1U69_10345 [Parvibaculaceae bacterium]|nr:hypothetical protein [Parvibaculaceae bacterium]
MVGISEILFNWAIVSGSFYHGSSRRREFDAAGTSHPDEIGCAVFYDHAGPHE